MLTEVGAQRRVGSKGREVLRFRYYPNKIRELSELISDDIGVEKIRLDSICGDFVEFNFNTNRFICGKIPEHNISDLNNSISTYQKDIMYHGTFKYMNNTFTLYYLNTVDESHKLIPLSEQFQFTSSFVMINTDMKKYKWYKNKNVSIVRCGFGLKFSNPITPTRISSPSSVITSKNDNLIPDEQIRGTKQFYLFWGGL